MLSGSAILRVLLLILAAAGLAWIIQSVWLHGPDSEAAATVTPGRPSGAASAPPPVPVRVVKPAEPSPEPPRPVAEAPPPALPASPPADPAPSPAPVARTAPPESDPAAEAEENAPPAVVSLIDLNTASLAELNSLKGGGAIGRTIVQHRPYASVDQLLSKRVLNRATYQRIKDQVSVR
ncbi:ComEA family DNA-binding protein [Methylorubrum sp. SL192]|uniref:ComEA family DNA-binding protein n=1 Tax=Methylorubrum sp. SL192 TaxID=2995167 RepID=UPI0022726E00|nr:helix-hairpin-helix domain-containing protein [Methylorubrum sp. SL192]MCY1644120.1 helix-hairpin-helix domain-containing protein [Methylorubrum sp. SL192]